MINWYFVLQECKQWCVRLHLHQINRPTVEVGEYFIPDK